MKCHDKVVYMTVREALHFCDRLYKSTGRLQSPYLCKNCQTYHLTSKLKPTEKRSIRMYLEREK